MADDVRGWAWGYPEKNAWSVVAKMLGSSGREHYVGAIEVLALYPDHRDPLLALPLHHEAKCLRIACLLGLATYDWREAGYDRG